MRLIKLRNAFSLTILLLFGLLGVKQASAVANFGATTTELRLLPPFCQAKLSPSQIDDGPYSRRIGPDYKHIHHYCYALYHIDRYKKSFANKSDQRYYFQVAIDNLNYVFKHSAPTFWMRPEMHVQKGKLLAAAKQNVEAQKEFEQALQINPNYVQAYVALSYLYKNTGQQSKYITALEQALQLAPNSKSMQSRYKQVTGKTFTPPPPTVEQAAQIPPTPIPVAQAAAASGVSSITTQPVSASSPVVVPDKIGTPTNPYCRFCPPE